MIMINKIKANGHIVLMVMAPVALMGFLFAQNGESTKSAPPVVQSGTIPATPARPFPGQRIPALPANPAVPQPRLTCAKSSQFSMLSLLDPSWSIKDPAPLIDNYYTYHYRVETMLKSRSGALFVAGYKSTNSGWAPVMHKSTDSGVSWKLARLPLDNEKPGWSMVYSMVEDNNSVIYAGGTGLWKSSDNGNTWIALPMPWPDVYLGGSVPIFSMFVTKNNALVAAFNDWSAPESNNFSTPSRAYKSVDGGSTWNEIFSRNVATVSIVEADDGSLVFRDWLGPDNGGVSRYSDGVITQTFIDNFARLVDYNAELLKARDGSLYFIAVDTAVDLAAIDYTQPGHALLATYKSVDNGKTWKKLGTLPNSWSIQGPIIETADGILYFPSYSVCNATDSLYKSTDKGVTWSVVAAAPEFRSRRPGHEYYYGISSLIENSGNILIGGNAPVIFTAK